MSTTKQPRRMARTPLEAVSRNAKLAVAAASAPLPVATKRPSKQDLVVNLMRGEGGASMAAIIATTGWLPHTARAALTGLRKKGHVIEKSKVDGETRYSIKAGVAQ